MGRLLWSATIGLLIAGTVYGDAASIGPNGINSAGLGLTGAGIGIGQAEFFRPADASFDTTPAVNNNTIDPAQVFFHSGATFTATPNIGSEISQHALGVAGLMISSDPVGKGVAAPSGMQPGADLYSIGGVQGPLLPDVYNQVSENLQFLAQRGPASGTQKIWAINQSLNLSAGMNQLNGSALPTQFIDWSARTHDVLYVIAGFEAGGTGAIPSDNFNGITVAYSTKEFAGNVWTTVSSGNTFVTNPAGDRTFVDILAPGADLSLADGGSVMLPPSPMREGTSQAAPHVTGTVALLQQFAAQQIAATGAPRWKPSPGMGQFAPSQRHEVMKAVLMNSADKIIDNGTFTVPGDANPAPVGTFLGMEKTILKSIGNPPLTWFNSAAYDDDVNQSGAVPLDEQMGTGQLNAKRALQQFKPGEFDANGAAVPNIGWDSGSTTGAGNNQKYVFAQPLTAGMFISITLTWDRHVDLVNNVGPAGVFNAGDTFTQSMTPAFDLENDDQINDLDIHLLPQGAATTAAAVASSVSGVGTVEHMFFRIPTTGNYEFWVRQFDQEAFAAGQDYAVAWWYGLAPPLVAGDYTGDSIVNRDDYDFWKLHYGETVSPLAGADGNGDGVINAADYTVWRNALAGISGSGSSVPEPSGLALFAIAGILFACRRCAA
jgi:hypothetical protein